MLDCQSKPGMAAFSLRKKINECLSSSTRFFIGREEMKLSTAQILAVAAIGCTIWSVKSFAISGCDEGAISTNLNPLDDPEDVRACQFMGRAFCRVTVAKAAGVKADAAINHSVEWFDNLDRRGTHLKSADTRPMVTMVAQYIYAHEPLLPWTSYYYGVYTCGAGNRVGGEPAQKQAAMAQWEKSAIDCESRFPGKGEGAGNDDLKHCFASAMKAVTGQK